MQHDGRSFAGSCLAQRPACAACKTSGPDLQSMHAAAPCRAAPHQIALIDSPLFLQSTTGTLLASQGVSKWQTGPRAQHAETTRPQVSLHNVPLRQSTRQATRAIRSCGLQQLLPGTSVLSCKAVSLPVQVSTPAAMTARWDCSPRNSANSSRMQTMGCWISTKQRRRYR